MAGARYIMAVDPLPFKTEKAKEIGATHKAASIAGRARCCCPS